MLDQVTAARLLLEFYYDWVPASWDPSALVPTIGGVRPELVDPVIMQARREVLLGKDFKWEIVPHKDAKYL